MFKLAKWECINFIKKFSSIYLIFCLIMIVALFFPIKNPYSSNVAMICSIVTGVLYGISVIALIEMVFNWLNKKTVILEGSTPIAEWKVLLTKTMVLVLIQFVNSLLMILLSIVLNRFATENNSFLSIYFNDAYAILSYLVLVNMVVLSDFLTRVIYKRKNGLLAAMIFIILGVISIYIFAFLLKITGSADVVFYGLSISIKNESNLVVRYVLYSLFIISSFILNSKLLQKRIDM